MPLILSLVWLTATAAVLMLLYAVTRYLPLLLGGLTVMLPTLIYGVVALFCNGAQPKPVCEDAADRSDATGFIPKTVGALKRALAWLVRTYFKFRVVATVVLSVVVMCGAHLIFWAKIKKKITHDAIL